MKNITVKQYLKLRDKLDYNLLLSALKPKDSFHYEFSLDKLSYNDVRRLEMMLTNVNTMEDVKNIFMLAYKCEESHFWQLSIVDFFHTKGFIADFFVNLKRKEVQLFQSFDKDSLKWNAAAGDTLKPYESIAIIDAYSKVYGGHPEVNGEMKYSVIMFYASYNAKINMIQKEVKKMR